MDKADLSHRRLHSYEVSTLAIAKEEMIDRTKSLNRGEAHLSTLLSAATLNRPSALSKASMSTDSAVGQSVPTNTTNQDCTELRSLPDSDSYDDTGIDEDLPKADKKILPSLLNPRSLFSRKSSGTDHSTDLRNVDQSTSNSRSTALGSTTGLLLAPRPANLPAKSPEEEKKHRQQYEKMLELIRKKEQKEQKDQKKKMQQRIKQEEKISNLSQVWQKEILPNWAETRTSRKTRELWWKGIPTNVRGRVWSLSIGNDGNITEDLYQICCKRANERRRAAQKPEATISASNVDREGSMDQIYLDVQRTFPSLGLFQEGGPYYDLLLNLLCAYACYRPDVGYVQSMSFIAAVLLLNMEHLETFIAFSNLMNRPLQRTFFGLRQPEMTYYFIAYDHYMAAHLPRLHAHFESQDVRPDLYLIEWIYTMYARSLPLDLVSRIWDVYFRDGDDFLFQTALGILATYEPLLLSMEFDNIVQFLSNLPMTTNDADTLFEHIQCQQSSTRSLTANMKAKSFNQLLDEVAIRHQPLNMTGAKLGHCRNTSNTSNASLQGCGSLSISKGMTTFISDWLSPPPPSTSNMNVSRSDSDSSRVKNVDSAITS